MNTARTVGLGVALGLVAGVGSVPGTGCGRTPVIRPCTERLDPPSVLTCDPDEICEAPRFTIRNRPANVLIVLDRSCSMAVIVGNQSKWDRAVEAIDSIVAEPRANLRWGLSLFPARGRSACDTEPLPVPVGPDQEARISRLLTLALDSDNAYHPREPCGTNLAGATERLLDDDPFAALDGRDYIVLITDGAQAACSGTGLDAVANIAALRDDEVGTVVVGFGGREDTNVLQQLGEAGGVPASGPTAYHLAGLDDLDEVLQRVIAGIGCHHPLAIDAPLDRVDVHFDDVHPVPRDLGSGDGWRQEGSALVFVGETCDRLLRGEIESIDISLRCG